MCSSLTLDGRVAHKSSRAELDNNLFDCAARFAQSDNCRDIKRWQYNMYIPYYRSLHIKPHLFRSARCLWHNPLAGHGLNFTIGEWKKETTLFLIVLLDRVTSFTNFNLKQSETHSPRKSTLDMMIQTMLMQICCRFCQFSNNQQLEAWRCWNLGQESSFKNPAPESCLACSTVICGLPWGQLLIIDQLDSQPLCHIAQCSI